MSTSPRLSCSQVRSPIAVLLTLLAAFTVSTPIQASSLVTPTTITSIGIYAGTTGALGAYVYFSPAAPGLENCTDPTGHQPGNELWIDFTSTLEPTGKTLYTTAVSGWLSGHTVIFEVNGCGDQGHVPLVYNVELRP